MSSACAIIFAGSLAGTLSNQELEDWFRAYLLGQPLDAYTNKLVSSSMMEYTVFKGLGLRRLADADAEAALAP